ncbi:hypothetical protein Fmac_013309 [Flemingia macrophylla]|uniref:Uncharacterized protein n=1 Tax=Flemingia macrophylla TaxID=520843 RepID=A0ABD1MSR8_9FABA
MDFMFARCDVSDGYQGPEPDTSGECKFKQTTHLESLSSYGHQCFNCHEAVIVRSMAVSMNVIFRM